MTIVIWSRNSKKQGVFAILQRTTINRNGIDDAYIIIPKPIGFYDWNNISDGKCQISLGLFSSDKCSASFTTIFSRMALK